MARQIARRHRRERLGGIALALVGILVLAIALFALQHPRDESSAAGTPTGKRSSSPIATKSRTVTTPPASSSTPATSTPGTGTPQRLPLLVLNNTTIKGLAQQAKETFTAGGWTVTDTGNLQNEIASTCAYYDPSVPGALEAATSLRAQFPAIKRVVPKFAELPAGPIVVVLTPDYVSG